MSVLCAPLEETVEGDKLLSNSSNNHSSNKNKLFVKGAPNMLLQRCTHAKLRDGKIVPLSSQLRDRIDATIGSIGDRALRCIGLAVQQGECMDPHLWKENQQYNEYLKDSSKFEAIETNMIFIGMVAIKDPPRPGVAESIDLCKKAGIRVIMITGDAKATAVAIAKDVHIFNIHDDLTTAEEPNALEGREFFALPKSKQLDILKSGNMVICRAEPADKQRLVKMLQTLDEIPAMTGDGVRTCIRFF